MDWNKEASVIFWDDNTIPVEEDFEQSLNPRSGERWWRTVEAYGSVYGRIMAGDTSKPWILTHDDGKIHSPDDIKDEWPQWVAHISKYGPYGN